MFAPERNQSYSESLNHIDRRSRILALSLSSCQRYAESALFLPL